MVPKGLTGRDCLTAGGLDGLFIGSPDGDDPRIKKAYTRLYGSF